MRRWLRWFEYALWMTAVASLGYAGVHVWTALWSQHEGAHQLLRHHVNAPVAGGVFGLLEIPRLELSVVVFEGDGDDVLARGAGHLIESASLADAGNVVMAGHRDTFFRPLRNVRIGDTIKVRTVAHERTYVVESTRVVAPEDVSVLDSTSESVLTLVTCYPFHYIGPAPNRFIVRAKETHEVQGLSRLR